MENGWLAAPFETRRASAAPSAPGAVVQAPAQTVHAGAGAIQLTVRTSAGYHYERSRPLTPRNHGGDGKAARFSAKSVSWEPTARESAIVLPARFAQGQTTLTLSATLYYCREGEEALCFIKRVRLALPLQVSPGAAETAAQLGYDITPGE